MSTPIYRVIVGQREVAEAVPLAEAPIGPWYEAVVWQGVGPTMYAVPRHGGGFEWVEWPAAARRGWVDDQGQAEHPEAAAERRFLVLYYPPPFRAWPFFWRIVQPRPRRLGPYRAADRSEVEADRRIRRRQVGFQSAGWRGVRQAWGWDDREVPGHVECYPGCDCDGPAPMRDYVLIAEFENAALAKLPDATLEREAWMARLDAGRAIAITAHCEGDCDPACAHCSATHDEIDAAWEWCSTHRREVRAWRRERRQEAVGC
jgi:hypothetical protein